MRCVAINRVHAVGTSRAATYSQNANATESWEITRQSTGRFRASACCVPYAACFCWFLGFPLARVVCVSTFFGSSNYFEPIDGPMQPYWVLNISL